MNTTNTIKVGDKVIYHGHACVVKEINGDHANLEYPNPLMMTVYVMGIQLTELVKA